MGRLTKEQIKKIVGDRKIYTAFETGTYRGEQLKVISDCFEATYGIEINEYYAEMSQKNAPNTYVHYGSTLDVLPEYCEKINEPVCFFLDAHYCKVNPPIPKTEFPLWQELEMIKSRNKPDIVIVDDVHTFGKVRDELRYKEGAKEWESVTPKNLKAIFPDAKTQVIDDSFVIWL